MEKNLFDTKADDIKKKEAPLPERMRPKNFDEFFGQEELIGEGSPLRKSIEDGNLSSIIFWGPPGSGKTTLAMIIAKNTEAYFEHFSAVVAGIKDIRKVIKKAEDRLKFHGQKTLLFIDEIHRFNKVQQDALLPYVEDGTIVLIGATTENPSFEIISPLLSRSVVYILQSLLVKNLKKIFINALKNKEKGLGELGLKITDEAIEKLIAFSDGDARVGLNGLEFASKIISNEKKKVINKSDLDRILKKHVFRYDKKGEEHYNLISAYIKSMRDSDPNGALYWLARMVESGEDPKFIARRMVIFASEDIGNADSNAVRVAVAVFQAVEFIGLPEAEINLAHGTTYLSSAPKSNASYTALKKAKEDAKKGSYGVPMHLRNAVTNLMKKMGFGEGYKYAHDDIENAKNQTHFPKEMGEKEYYNEI